MQTVRNDPIQTATAEPTVISFKLLLQYVCLSVLTPLIAAYLTTQYQLQQLLRAPDEVTLGDNHIRTSVRLYLPDISKIRCK